MKPVGGYMKKFLRVDLSSMKIKEEELGDQLIEKYVGGTGFGARFLYDEVPPGVEWNDPKNRMMFFSGPLGATRISGTGTFSVVTKGPMTNMAGCSQANGLFPEPTSSLRVLMGSSFRVRLKTWFTCLSTTEKPSSGTPDISRAKGPLRPRRFY